MINILYKIYYGEQLVYLGRTHQVLTDRIRGHLFKAPGLKVIDIDMVSKIEYAELSTEADMFIYEIYYINKFKPIFNKDDKACDNMTITLPEITFKSWNTPLWPRWKQEIKKQKEEYQKNLDNKNRIIFEKEKIKAMHERGEMEGEEFQEKMQEIKKQELEIKLSKGEITFAEYCRQLNLTKIKHT